MYFGLYLCDEEEKKLIKRKKLDTGLVRTLMLIEPEIRKEIYKRIDKLLKKDYPVEYIIDFIESGDYKTRIEDVYEVVPREYWAAVSSYLKDAGIKSGTITVKFRSLLMNIKIYGASKNQLAWLERGIIHDFHNHLGIFTADSLRKDFPEAVKEVEKFINDYKRFDLGQDYAGE